MGNRLYRNMACWLLGFYCALPLGLSAQPVEENAMKAAFVYNFISFTEWPTNAFRKDKTINLCVNAESSMATALSDLGGKKVNGIGLNLQLLDSLQKDLSNCHILYVDRFDRSDWQAVNSQLKDKSVLTISDDEVISEKGVMIALARSDSKIVFDIDMTAARRSRLTLSSKLLRLARTVR